MHKRSLHTCHFTGDTTSMVSTWSQLHDYIHPPIHDDVGQQRRIQHILDALLQLIPVALVAAYPQAMLNIHPALLPAFGGKGYYGMRVHKAVVASGVRYTGATIHFVTEEYDTGPILAQSAVPVYPMDTPALVAARVLGQVRCGSTYLECTALQPDC